MMPGKRHNTTRIGAGEAPAAAMCPPLRLSALLSWKAQIPWGTELGHQPHPNISPDLGH